MKDEGERMKKSIAKKYKPYPAYVDSGVEWLGEIPEGWDVSQLKRTFLVVNGSTPSSSESSYWDGDIPWVTPEDLGNLSDAIITATRRYITQDGYRSCGTTIVPEGSLILSTRAPIGYLAIAGVSLSTNQGCRSLVFRKASFNKFFFYEIQAAHSELTSLGQGSTFLELSKGHLEDVEISIPSQPEQRIIAIFLDRSTSKIDALLAKYQKLLVLLAEKRSALISRAVTKGLDPDAPMKDSGVEWLGEIPEGWALKKLKLLCKIDTGNKDTIEAVHDGEYPFFVRSQTAERIDSYSFDGEAVLTAGDGAGVGKVFHYYNGKFDYHQRVYMMHSFSEIDALYFFYFLKEMFSKVALDGSAKSTVDSLRMPVFQNFYFSFPSKQDQKRIICYIEEKSAKLDALVAKVERAVDLLKEYRIALISAAVTGKIDLREKSA